MLVSESVGFLVLPENNDLQECKGLGSWNLCVSYYHAMQKGCLSLGAKGWILVTQFPPAEKASLKPGSRSTLSGMMVKLTRSEYDDGAYLILDDESNGEYGFFF
ncbi:hypothetical protein LINPERPRIM_LOCUS1519 [Linum perenne]